MPQTINCNENERFIQNYQHNNNITAMACWLCTGADHETSFRKYGGNASISKSIESTAGTHTTAGHHISCGIGRTRRGCGQLYIHCGQSFFIKYTGKGIRRETYFSGLFHVVLVSGITIICSRTVSMPNAILSISAA